jgi:hypothetical protein
MQHCIIRGSPIDVPVRPKGYCGLGICRREVQESSLATGVLHSQSVMRCCDGPSLSWRSVLDNSPAVRRGSVRLSPRTTTQSMSSKTAKVPLPGQNSTVAGHVATPLHQPIVHLHQKTEHEPSALSKRLILPSSGMPCFLPKGSVKRRDSFSQIGSISCFDIARGGLNRAGSACRMAKILVFDRPITS